MSDKKKDTTEMNFEDLQDVNGGYILYDKKNFFGDKCYSVVDVQGNVVSANGYSKEQAQSYANKMHLSGEEISKADLDKIRLSSDLAKGKK